MQQVEQITHEGRKRIIARQSRKERAQCIKQGRMRIGLLGQLSRDFGRVLRGVPARQIPPNMIEQVDLPPFGQRAEMPLAPRPPRINDRAAFEQIDADRDTRLRAALDALGDQPLRTMHAAKDHQHLRRLAVVQSAKDDGVVALQRHGRPTFRRRGAAGICRRVLRRPRTTCAARRRASCSAGPDPQHIRPDQ